MDMQRVHEEIRIVGKHATLQDATNVFETTEWPSDFTQKFSMI